MSSRWSATAVVVVALVALAAAVTACSSSDDQVATTPTSGATGTTLDPALADGLAGAAGKGTTSTRAGTAADAIQTIDFGDFTYAPDTCGDDSERAPFVVQGFPLTSSLISELGSIDLNTVADRLPARTLALTSNAARDVKSPFADLAAALRRSRGDSAVEMLDAPPAWQEHNNSGTALIPVDVLQRIKHWLS